MYYSRLKTMKFSSDIYKRTALQ